MKFKRIVLIVTFLLVTSAIVLASCTLLVNNNLASFGDIAENSVVKKITTADGKYTAVAFIRNAGMTTAFSPQVSILKNGEKFDNSITGNVFIGSKSKDIDIKWKDSKNLVISYKGTEKIMEKNKFEDITIKYEDIQDK